MNPHNKESELSRMPLQLHFIFLHSNLELSKIYNNLSMLVCDFKHNYVITDHLVMLYGPLGSTDIED